MVWGARSIKSTLCWLDWCWHCLAPPRAEALESRAVRTAFLLAGLSCTSGKTAAGQTNPSKFHSVLPLNVSKGVYMCLPVWWEGNQMDLIPSSNSFLTMRQVSSLHHLDATTPQNKDFLSTKGINPADCELWMALDCRQWDVMLGTHDCMCRKAASRKVGSAQLYKSNDCYYTFSNTHRPKR